MSTRWHILRESTEVWTLCRHLPPRFDVWAATTLPRVHPVRLMHQIRQDIWRAVQRVRGFSPIVVLTPDAHAWHVQAGGRVVGRVAPSVRERLQNVLNNAAHRARWVHHAGPWEAGV